MRIWSLLLASGLAATSVAAQARPPRVAMILDRPSARFEPMVASFQREVRAFFRPDEIALLAPVSGDGSVAGVTAALKASLGDPSIAAVVALGATGSHLLLQMGPLPKPAIAAVIADAAWQHAPSKGGATGVRNLVYVDQSYPIGATLVEFHKLTPFRKLAVILDRDQLVAIPQLRSGAAGLVRDTGAEAVIVAADADPDAVLAAIPADADAAFLSPLALMSDAGLARLLAGLNARRLPTLSYLAEPDIQAGALASYEPPESWLRRARRVAVNLQRALAGEDAGTLPVKLVSAPRLTLNLATARTIGFPVGRSLLTDAALVGVDSAGPADTLSLVDAMRTAAASNLDVTAARLEAAAGAQTVRLARSNLLPRIESSLGETFTRSGTAAASLGQQPERLLEGGVTMGMPIYSERAWAGYGAEKKLQAGREARRDEVRLDAVLDAATGFLDVLRARTLTDVRRINLYRNRSNLETARLREGVGSASRADIYRWQGEVATARRDLIAAESQVRIAGLELNRILNRPLDRPLAQRAVSLADQALLAQDSTILGWLDQPERFAALTRFLSAEAQRTSPELQRADAALAAQQRQETAAKRAFWVPDLSLQGGFSNVLSRGGAGSTAPSFPTSFDVPQAPDLTWQFRVQASIPIFTGFSRSATRAQASLDLERLGVQRQVAAQSIDRRIRAALETAASSYAAIALTRDAAEAAGRNYDLVSDAYGRGAASITALIDAQTAALSASEAAANAIHDFLLDLIRVERAMGGFGAIQAPAQREAFLQRLRALQTA